MQRLLKSGSDIEIASAAAQATEQSKHVGALGEKSAEIQPTHLLYTSQLTCRIGVAISISGLDDLVCGPNNVNTKPRVILTPTDGTPINVNHMLSHIKDMNIQFTLHEAGI